MAPQYTFTKIHNEILEEIEPTKKIMMPLIINSLRVKGVEVKASIDEQIQLRRTILNELSNHFITWLTIAFFLVQVTFLVAKYLSEQKQFVIDIVNEFSLSNIIFITFLYYIHFVIKNIFIYLIIGSGFYEHVKEIKNNKKNKAKKN
jgi:hypothetical protein